MKGDMNHAAAGRERLDHGVIEISRRIAQRTATGMRCDHRRAGSFQNIVKGRIGNVGNIDEHSEPIHFPDYLFAEIRQPVVAWRRRSRNRPIPSPRCASASCSARRAREIPAKSQGRCRWRARLRLPASRRFCSPLAPSGLLCERRAKRQIAAMNFDLFQRGSEQIPRALRSRRARNFHRHPQGKEDGSNASLAQPGDIDAALGVAMPQVKLIEEETLRRVGVRVEYQA